MKTKQITNIHRTYIRREQLLRKMQNTGQTAGNEAADKHRSRVSMFYHPVFLLPYTQVVKLRLRKFINNFIPTVDAGLGIEYNSCFTSFASSQISC